MVTQNILIVLVHYFRVVDRDLMFHVSECAISGAHCVTIEEAPELVTRRITLVKGRKHSPNDAARDSIIPGRIIPELAALTIAGGPGLVEFGNINLLIL